MYCGENPHPIEKKKKKRKKREGKALDSFQRACMRVLSDVFYKKIFLKKDFQMKITSRLRTSERGGVRGKTEEQLRDHSEAHARGQRIKTVRVSLTPSPKRPRLRIDSIPV